MLYYVAPRLRFREDSSLLPRMRLKHRPDYQNGALSLYIQILIPVTDPSFRLVHHRSSSSASTGSRPAAGLAAALLRFSQSVVVTRFRAEDSSARIIWIGFLQRQL